MADIIQANYEQLDNISACFGQHAENNTALTTLVRQGVTNLKRDWEGKGSAAFLAEMEGEVFPALQRLTEALEQARSVTLEVKNILQAAEEEAAAPFRGTGNQTAFTPQTTSTPAFAQTSDEPFLPKWLTDLLDGIFLGDFSENSSLMKLLAQIGVGFIPYAGQAADIRDIIANIKNVIEGKELAWAGLALAVLAIIPSLDALKAGKALKPIFKGLGDKGSREVVEFLLKNPDQIGRVAKTLGTLLDHPEVIEALAKNPDAAMRLIREGTPELVEAYAKYGDEAFNIIKAIPDPHRVFEGFDLRAPQRKLDDIPGSKLTPEVDVFVTPGKHGDFNQLPSGTVGDKETLLLWTIDEQGAHFVPENIPWNSSRKMPSHTNISDTAFFGGEAWRTGPNEITINAASGAFGYNGSKARGLTGEALAKYNAEAQARFERATEYFRQLGFEVKIIPIKFEQ